jgi:hypothetical protein
MARVKETLTASGTTRDRASAELSALMCDTWNQLEREINKLPLVSEGESPEPPPVRWRNRNHETDLPSNNFVLHKPPRSSFD